MRGMVPALGTPYPIGAMSPAIMQEDPLAMRLTEALDEVIAPAIASLDCLHAYVDPRLAPTDFLDWLAGWVGVELNENWPPERQRAVVAVAVGLHRTRGTVAGLRDYLSLATGGTVEITDSGGTTWSDQPDAALPGEPTPHVHLHVTLPPGSVIPAAVIDDLVNTAKPVHMTHQVTVIVSATRPPGVTAGLTSMAGVVAIAVRPTICGLPPVVSVKARAAGRRPAPRGTSITATVQTNSTRPPFAC